MDVQTDIGQVVDMFTGNKPDDLTPILSLLLLVSPLQGCADFRILRLQAPVRPGIFEGVFVYENHDFLDVGEAPVRFRHCRVDLFHQILLEISADLRPFDEADRPYFCLELPVLTHILGCVFAQEDPRVVEPIGLFERCRRVCDQLLLRLEANALGGSIKQIGIGVSPWFECYNTRTIERVERMRSEVVSSRASSSEVTGHGLRGPNAQAQPRACRSEAEARRSAGAPCWASLRASAGLACLAFQRVACNTELVSVRVPKVGTVVVLVILGPQTGRSLRCAAIGKRDLVGIVDERTAGG